MFEKNKIIQTYTDKPTAIFCPTCNRRMQREAKKRTPAVG